MQDLHLLDCHKSAAHQLVKDGKEAVNLFLRVNDLHNHWKILRKAQYLRCMQPCRMTKPKMSSQHCSTSEMHLPRFEHDRLV